MTGLANPDRKIGRELSGWIGIKFNINMNGFGSN
jgi:hypothetical protein